jgi:MoaA/NifB/PqqE/SkfB family radical SAM enzyme
MCHVWRNPTLPSEEIDLATLEKVPNGIDNLNITGGEPTLRADLMDMVEILYPKARKLEISSNGLHPERLEAVIRKYPDVKIRFSLEGREAINNLLRGEDNGFEIKVTGLKRLKELGGCDLGFATVIQDDNIDDLIYIFKLTQEMGVELATSTLHNGYQFHKNDNFPYDRIKLAKGIEKLILEMLKRIQLRIGSELI